MTQNPRVPAILSANEMRALLISSWVGNMEDGAARKLIADALVSVRQISLANGELLFARGDLGDGFYTLARGALRFSRATVDGRASMISLLEPPVWFGELSSFDGLPRTHDAHAIGPAIVLHHGQADFERLVGNHPLWFRSMVRQMCQRMRFIYDRLEDLAVLPFSARLARQLLELAGHHGMAHPRQSLPSGASVVLTHETLGQLLGKTRQSIARHLAEWEADGLIDQGYGKLRIIDVDGLRKIACQ